MGVEQIQSVLINEISRLLEVPSTEIDMQQPIIYLGMDSILIWNLNLKIQQIFYLSLPLKLFNNISVNGLTKEIFGRL